MIRSLVALTLALSVVAATPLARAQAPQDDAARKQAALVNGTRWLADQQKPDGSWAYDNMPLQLTAFPMLQGVTALCAFSLLKCGFAPDEPHIVKAFAFLEAQPMQWTYSVSCVLLAVEARINHEPPPEAGAAGASVARRKPRPSPRDLQLAQRCVDFICQHQQRGLWRYPAGTQEDVSNAQYALLALDAAERLGIQVPVAVYEKVALRLVEMQEQTGPDVASFSVPGADKTFRELREIQADLEKEIRKIQRPARPGREPEAGAPSQDDQMRTAERNAQQRITETRERGAMRSRGWAYFAKEEPGAQDWQLQVNGSMTASGMSALIIAKSHLEGSPKYERELKPRVNQAIKDAAGWLATHYSVTENPGGPLHHYYYLYGLERAGILGLVARFGDHDWYSEGSNTLLAQQRHDGSWLAGRSTSGPVPDTCFALLFLARGTTPIVNVRIATGGPSAPDSTSQPRQPAAPPGGGQ